MAAFWDKLKRKKEKDQVDEKKSAGLKDDKKSSAKAKTSDPKSLADSKKKEAGSKKEKKSKKKAKKKVAPEKATLVERVLMGPMISEDVMNKQEQNKYVFRVNAASSKPEIIKAVEGAYQVTVEKVNVSNYKARPKLFRGKKGKTSGYKKAIVSIQDGQSIDLF